MKKTRLLATLIAISGMSLFALSTKADLVITSSTPYAYHFTSSSNPSDSAIASALGITTSQLGSLLYKINSDGSEAGTLTSSYNGAPVSGGNFSSFPITISYVSGTVADATYLLVKDGNLGSYVYDISGWNGTDVIDIYNLFSPKDSTGTSHVEFFGTVQQTTAVPEPSTVAAGALLLLPLGFNALRVLRKNKVS